MINPTKSELGKVSKIILERVVSDVKSKSGLQLWKNTKSVIDWFNGLQNKGNLKFIQFDINTFYPKISKKLVTKAVEYARQFTTITNQQKKIIIQSSRDILINNGQIWVKKGDADKFSVTMGSFSGAEVCELVGLYLLHLITTTLKVPKKLIGLYRDDGLLVTSARPRQVETLRKKLCELFPKVGLSIEAHANLNTVDFLDVTFNLSMDTYKPFMKPGDYPRYVDLQSDHPPQVHKILPLGVQTRLSTNSSSKEMFDAAAPPYQAALNQAGYPHTLEYDERAGAGPAPNARNRRNRRRNEIFYCPPFSRIVETKIGKEFLRAIDKSFPPGNALHKKLTRHNVKLSYSCMPNMKKRIGRNNRRILNSGTDEEVEPCVCTRYECPLQGDCGKKNMIYQAEVICEDGRVEFYIGSCSTTFKARYGTHRTNMNNPKYRDKGTRLSKFTWELKDQGINFQVKWRIVDRAPPYNPRTRKCALCTRESYYINYQRHMATLNSRFEVFGACRHRNMECLVKHV